MARPNSTPRGTVAPVTVSKPFEPLGPDGTYLLTVTPGIPALAALEQASCYFDEAERLAIAMLTAGDDAEHMGAVVYLLGMGKAVVDAVVGGLMKAEASHG